MLSFRNIADTLITLGVRCILDGVETETFGNDVLNTHVVSDWVSSAFTTSGGSAMNNKIKGVLTVVCSSFV